jgi:hypothetical protein
VGARIWPLIKWACFQGPNPGQVTVGSGVTEGTGQGFSCAQRPPYMKGVTKTRDVCQVFFGGVNTQENPLGGMKMVEWRTRGGWVKHAVLICMKILGPRNFWLVGWLLPPYKHGVLIRRKILDLRMLRKCCENAAKMM